MAVNVFFAVFTLFFAHCTTPRLYATQRQKVQNLPPVQVKRTFFERTWIPGNPPKRQFYRNLQCFVPICNADFEAQKSANHFGPPSHPPPPILPVNFQAFPTLSVINISSSYWSYIVDQAATPSPLQRAGIPGLWPIGSLEFRQIAFPQYSTSHPCKNTTVPQELIELLYIFCRC